MMMPGMVMQTLTTPVATLHTCQLRRRKTGPGISRSRAEDSRDEVGGGDSGSNEVGGAVVEDKVDSRELLEHLNEDSAQRAREHVALEAGGVGGDTERHLVT